MAKVKPVGSPEERFSAFEFLKFLQFHNLTDANAARVLGVSESTIKYCRKHGINGFGARLLMVFELYNVDPITLAERLDIPLSLFTRDMYEKRPKSRGPIRGVGKPSKIHRAMVLGYLKEEDAATTERLQGYFERKTGKPRLVEPMLAEMQAEGAIHCDDKGNWQIGMAKPNPAPGGVARPVYINPIFEAAARQPVPITND